MVTRKRPRTDKQDKPLGWAVLIYRVPTEPASKRVSVWRDLKRLGALYLQQCVCIVPDVAGVVDELEAVAAKIPAVGGEMTLLQLPRLRPADEVKIIAAYRTQRASEYAEIIEERETQFVKEVEFEHFRQNYTFEEAEEIEQDLEKIRRWFTRVQERDWFGAERREEVEAWLVRCQDLLAGFEEEVYRRSGTDDTAHALPPEEATPDPGSPPRPIISLRATRGRTRGARGAGATSSARRHQREA